MASRPSTPGKRRRWPAIALLALVLVTCVLGYFLEAPDVIAVTRDAVRGAGAWAPVAFGAGYVLGTLVGVPGLPLTILCAWMFGTWEAFVIMVVATTVSSVVAFVVARDWARDSIESWLGNDSRFCTIKGWVEHNPWIAIPFVRVMPLFPYAVVNYGLGLTRTPFWTHFWATELAMIPTNALFVGLAGSLYRFVVRGETPWWLFAATLGAALVLLLVGVVGKRFLAPHEPREA